jgi:hypothetical protein
MKAQLIVHYDLKIPDNRESMSHFSFLPHDQAIIPST